MNSYRFLIATENSQYQNILSNIIAKLFPGIVISKFDDGLDTLQSIEKYDMYSILITSYNTHGLNAFQVLKKLQDSKRTSNTYSIFISEKRDKEFNIKILNQGFDDFLNAPFSLDEIISKLKSATRVIKEQTQFLNQYNEAFELKEELTKFRDRTYEIIKTLQATRFPDLEKIVSKYKDTSIYISTILGLNDLEVNEIAKAAELSLLNKMFLTDIINRNLLTPDGHPANPSIPVAQEKASKVIAEVWGSDKIAQIINHIYENFDGTGFPLGNKGWQIPMGSRILRVMLDYDELILIKKVPHSKALEELELNKNRFYDPKVVCLLDQYQGFINPKEKRIQLEKLTPGMVVARNIYTETFNKIVGAGTTITIEKIEKLNTIVGADPILGHIYIAI